MKSEMMTDIFVKQIGARKDGNVFLVPDNVEVTVFVMLSGETLQIPRVNRMELSDGLVNLDTQRGDRFVAVVDHVAVVKIDRNDNSRRERGAGFGK